MNNAEFESRLERLECRVNRYRIASVVLGLGLIGLAGIAATSPTPVSQEIRTHTLYILDAQGKETIKLSSGPHGGVLDVLITAGRPVFRAGAGEKGGQAMLSDAEGLKNIELSSEDAGGQLIISDKKGQKNLLKATPAR